MVTANFGKPFAARRDASGRLLPEPPAPHYPNVSSVKYDANDGLIVYRQLLRKEKDLASTSQKITDSREDWRPASPHVNDLFPGYSSINSTVKGMRYTIDFSTMRRIQPEFHDDRPQTGSSKSTPSKVGSIKSYSQPNLQTPADGRSAGGGFAPGALRSSSRSQGDMPTLGPKRGDLDMLDQLIINRTKPKVFRIL